MRTAWARPVTYRRVVVTNKLLLGKTVSELGLEQLFGVTVTRITRADLEMTAVPNLRLQSGTCGKWSAAKKLFARRPNYWATQ